MKALLVYAVPYVPLDNVWLLNTKSIAVKLATNVTSFVLLNAKLLKYVTVSPFTNVLALLHVVLAALAPYLAFVVSRPDAAVQPVNVYPVQLGLAILNAVPYVAVLFAYVVLFNTQPLVADVYLTV